MISKTYYVSNLMTSHFASVKEKIYYYQTGISDKLCEFWYRNRKSLMIRKFCYLVNDRIDCLSSKLINWNEKSVHVERYSGCDRRENGRGKSLCLQKKVDGGLKRYRISSMQYLEVAIYRVSNIFKIVYFSDTLSNLFEYIAEE